MTLRIDSVREDDLYFIAAHMRGSDRDEVEALGKSSMHALADAVRVSDEACVLRDDLGRPVCVYGIRLMGNLGFPWMLGTTLIASHRREFMRHSQAVVQEHRSMTHLLVNIVDSRNEPAILWLSSLGFDIDREAAWKSPSGHLFFPFTQAGH